MGHKVGVFCQNRIVLSIMRFPIRQCVVPMSHGVFTRVHETIQKHVKLKNYSKGVRHQHHTLLHTDINGGFLLTIKLIKQSNDSLALDIRIGTNIRKVSRPSCFRK